MNYIYDILLNFNKDIYEFYDWNKSDKIRHIRKIPIFKVSSNTLYEIKNNIVEFKEDFILKISDKTEEFVNKKVKILGNACIFTDSLDAIAVLINKELSYSKLLIDEEIDVIDISRKLTLTDVDYNILKNKPITHFKTRKENEISIYVKRELHKIIKENNDDELKYIYYECFNKKGESIEKIIDSLKEKMDNKDILEKMYDFLKLKNV